MNDTYVLDYDVDLDVPDYGPIGEPPDDIDPLAVAERERIAEQRGSSQGLRLLTLDQIENLPPPEWLIQDLMLDESFTVLFGPPGALKSFLALDWALCISAGYIWQGTHRTLPGGVVYAAGEGVAGMRQRTRAWRAHNAHARDAGPNFRLVPSGLRLHDPSTAPRVIDAINDETFGSRAKLLVVDTWGRAMSGADENSTQDTSHAIGVIDAIREATGVSVLVIHHTNASGERERGNTALRAAADQVIKAVREDQGPVTLRSEKIKDGVPFRPIVLEPQEVENSLVLVRTDEAPSRSTWGPSSGGAFF